MRGRKWVLGVLGALVGAAGIFVFDFISENKSPQWIGVADPESSAADSRNLAVTPNTTGVEPAPPVSGIEKPVASEPDRNRDVDLVTAKPQPQISGEVGVSMGFAERTADRHPVAEAQVSIDPAVLETISQTLRKTICSTYDPLLDNLDRAKADLLSDLLLGQPSLISDLKVPNHNVTVPLPRKTVSKPTIPSPAARVASEDSYLPDLISRTQVIRDPVLTDMNVPIGALQKLSQPTELGLTGSSLHGDSYPKQPVSGRLPIGH